MIFTNQALNNVKFLNELVLIGEDFDAENHVIEFLNIIDFSSKITTLKKLILDMEVQIVRWDLAATDLFFNSDLYQYVIDTLGKDLYRKNGSIYLWDIQLHFLDDFISDRILCLNRYLENLETLKTRYISVAKIDTKIVKRLLDLKAFW